MKAGEKHSALDHSIFMLEFKEKSRKYDTKINDPKNSHDYFRNHIMLH